MNFHYFKTQIGIKSPRHKTDYRILSQKTGYRRSIREEHYTTKEANRRTTYAFLLEKSLHGCFHVTQTRVQYSQCITLSRGGAILKKRRLNEQEG